MAMRRRIALAGALATGALLAAGCGASHVSGFHAVRGGVAGARHVLRSPALTTRRIAGIGTVLADARGDTLYAFVPAAGRSATCAGGCAVAWPVLRGEGGTVVSVAGRPLHTYSGDPAPGQANGQALNANGGVWYVLSPAGTLRRGRVRW